MDRFQLEIGLFSLLLLSFAIFDSFMQMLNRKKIEKLHEELLEYEEGCSFSVSDIPLYAAIRQIERRVRNLKCADLCRLCRERELQDKKQTIQQQQEELKEGYFS